MSVKSLPGRDNLESVPFAATQKLMPWTLLTFGAEQGDTSGEELGATR